MLKVKNHNICSTKITSQMAFLLPFFYRLLLYFYKTGFVFSILCIISNLGKIY